MAPGAGVGIRVVPAPALAYPGIGALVAHARKGCGYTCGAQAGRENRGVGTHAVILPSLRAPESLAGVAEQVSPTVVNGRVSGALGAIAAGLVRAAMVRDPATRAPSVIVEPGAGGAARVKAG